MIVDTETVVAHEIKSLHSDVFPYLIVKTFSCFKENEGVVRKNASYFLDGLACINNEKLNENLVSRVLEKGLDNSDSSDKCLSIISSNPTLLNKLECVHKTRFEALMSSGLEEMQVGELSTKLSHPAVILKRTIDQLGFDYVNINYSTYLEVVVKKLPFRSGVIDFAIQDESLKALLVSELLTTAGSHNFDTANRFIDRFFDIEEKIVNIFSKKECLELVCEIVDAGAHGAWRSSEIVEGKFAEFSKLRNKVIAYINCSSGDALSVMKDKVDESITCDNFKSRYLEQVEQAND